MSGDHNMNQIREGYRHYDNPVAMPDLGENKGITLEEYDYNEAVVRYCLSYFSNLSKDEWKSIKPNFSILPKNNGIKDKSVKKLFPETIS
jgi:hypothetical protein